MAAHPLTEAMEALREGGGPLLVPADLGLSARAAAFLEMVIAGLHDDPACRARRAAAIADFWDGPVGSAGAAGKRYAPLARSFEDDDLRWLRDQATWAAERHAPEDPPLALTLAAIAGVAGAELGRRGASLVAAPTAPVARIVWRDGRPIPLSDAELAEADGTARDALAVAIGTGVGLVEAMALSWNTATATVVGRGGRPAAVKLDGQPALLSPVPAMLAGLVVGAVAGRAAWAYLRSPAGAARWRRFMDRPYASGRFRPSAGVYIAAAAAPVAFGLGWYAFGRLKLLVALAVPILAVAAYQHVMARRAPAERPTPALPGEVD